MVLSPSQGGAFFHVASLASELAKRGHHVAICGPHLDRAGEIDVEVIPIEIVRPLSPAEDARSVAQLVRVVRDFNPDLVHSHGSKGGVMARLARLGNFGCPLVSTPHGYAFAGALPRSLERPLFWLAERATTPLADRVICVCENEARLAQRFCPPSRVRVIHNGIEPRPRPAVDPRVAEFRGAGPAALLRVRAQAWKGTRDTSRRLSVVFRTTPDAKL